MSKNKLCQKLNYIKNQILKKNQFISETKLYQKSNYLKNQIISKIKLYQTPLKYPFEGLKAPADT